MSNEYWDNADATFLILKLDNIFVPFRVLDWRGKGSDSLIFQLDNITDEQEAQRLIGTEAFMLLSDMNLEDEVMPTWQSLVGYRVMDTDQGELGTVDQVDETTINTLITLSDGRLIPIHEDFIVDINAEDKLLTICLPFIFNA
jgi:16S rRNA processing protein RimM